MKNFILLILATCFTTVSFAQIDAIENYFSKYQDDERFTTVYVSPKMFQMISTVATGADEADVKINDADLKIIADVIKDLQSLRILTTEENPAAFYKEASKTIPTKTYEMLMSVRDKGENIRFFVKDDSAGTISELLLLVGGEDQFVLMSFLGKIDLKKIGKLAKTLDLDGAEHLEKLGEAQ